MPFTSETARQYGGPKPGAGRPRNRLPGEKKTAAEILRAIIEKHTAELGHKYITRALSKNGERCLIHAVDKLLPNEQVIPQNNVAVIISTAPSQRPAGLDLPVIETTAYDPTDDDNAQSQLHSHDFKVRIGGDSRRN